MKFTLGSLPVLFPYDYLYPEQLAYMADIKRAIDAGGHALLEMPSGTGKTISLLALILAHQAASDTPRKLIYCSRTLTEIEKTLIELKKLVAYRQQHNPAETVFAIGLSSRKNYCINPAVNKEKFGRAVDAKCRSLTAPWVRAGRATQERGLVGADDDQDGGEIQVCGFYENLESDDHAHAIPTGVYTMEDLKAFGAEKQLCPYYLARKMIPLANVVIYSYHYLLDPKVAELISKGIEEDAIIVFDEAHNIDNVCTESLSIDISRPVLDASARSLQDLSRRVAQIKEVDADRLQGEYRRLVEGLRETSEAREAAEIMANPALPDDILKESVPGNIRRAEHFIAFLKRFVEYLKTRLRVMHVVAESPTSFVQHVKELTFIDKKPLRFTSERLGSLIRTLELSDIQDLSNLAKVASFATLVSTYAKGFMIIIEPFENDADMIPNPILHFVCMDATIAMKPVFDRFKTVIITSGTLSPMELYPTLLGFSPMITESYEMTLTRNCFLPLVITRGSDQVAISSKFEVRNDLAVVRNFGNILLEYAKVVPDGIVAFFPSYLYMESIVSAWNELGMIQDILKYKLLFIETPDAVETSLALENYRAACNNGRGAILISVARGKVSEGIDFDHNYGRCVIMFGIPYQYTESRLLKAKLEYLRDTYKVRENDFLSFDALRHAAQCMGRVIRGKLDYGVMVFADKRYARQDKRSKLPKWMAGGFSEAATNLSTDMAVGISRKFLRSMAQEIGDEQLGVSLLDEKQVNEQNAAMEL